MHVINFKDENPVAGEKELIDAARSGKFYNKALQSGPVHDLMYYLFVLLTILHSRPIWLFSFIRGAEGSK